MLVPASWRTATLTRSTKKRSQKLKASSMQSTNYAYVNGRFVPENEATVSIFDRGFLYGDGVFETMRVYGGRVFRAAEHLARMFEGLSALGIEMVLSPEELRAACR